ncbi:recombinase family protein [Kitasatospora sp. GAS206B]|uniref:recombinase family protein n=1 Tax=Kitasatospora sp. GAS206B TaxID=3156256 RepID=UPI0035197971
MGCAQRRALPDRVDLGEGRQNAGPRRPAPVRSRLVPEPDPETIGQVVAYCRVSSADQESDRDRQVARVLEDATKQGLAAGEVVAEVGSALNGRRHRLYLVLSDPAERSASSKGPAVRAATASRALPRRAHPQCGSAQPGHQMLPCTERSGERDP